MVGEGQGVPAHRGPLLLCLAPPGPRGAELSEPPPRGARVWAQGPVWPGGLAPAPSQPQLCLLPGSASPSPGRIRLEAPSARQGAMRSLAGSTGLCSSALGPITETGEAGCPVLDLLRGGLWGLGVSRA